MEGCADGGTLQHSNGDGITIQGGVEMDGGNGGPPGDHAAGIPLITDRCEALQLFSAGVDTSIRQAFHLAYLLPANALCFKHNVSAKVQIENISGFILMSHEKGLSLSLGIVRFC